VDAAGGGHAVQDGGREVGGVHVVAASVLVQAREVVFVNHEVAFAGVKLFLFLFLFLVVALVLVEAGVVEVVLSAGVSVVVRRQGQRGQGRGLVLHLEVARHGVKHKGIEATTTSPGPATSNCRARGRGRGRGVLMVVVVAVLLLLVLHHPDVVHGHVGEVGDGVGMVKKEKGKVGGRRVGRQWWKVERRVGAVLHLVCCE